MADIIFKFIMGIVFIVIILIFIVETRSFLLRKKVYVSNKEILKNRIKFTVTNTSKNDIYMMSAVVVFFKNGAIVSKQTINFSNIHKNQMQVRTVFTNVDFESFEIIIKDCLKGV